jgi:dipeptidyl aminopeptidase/acylaminoacyl peptidase
VGSLPAVVADRAATRVAVFRQARFVRREHVRAPYVSVGGVQIDLETLGPRCQPPSAGIEIVDVGGYGSVTVRHEGYGVVWPVGFAGDGRRLAYARAGSSGTRLWWRDVDGSLSRTFPGRINATPALFGEPLACWTRCGTTLLSFLPTARTFGVGEVLDTIEERRLAIDCTRHPRSAATLLLSTIARYSVADGTVTPFGPSGLYRGIRCSPDGRYLLVDRHDPVQSPGASLIQWRVYSEVWTYTNDLNEPTTAAVSPAIAVGGSVEYGAPQRWHWHATAPSTIVWASDRDDAGTDILAYEAPFIGRPTCIYRTHRRVVRFCWTPEGDLLLLERERDGAVLLHILKPGEREPLLVSRHEGVPFPGDGLREPWRADRVVDPGELRPVWGPGGARDGLVAQDGTRLYVSSLDRVGKQARWRIQTLDTRTRHVESIYASPRGVYERGLAALGSASGRLLATAETSISQPLHVVIDLRTGRRTPLAVRPRTRRTGVAIERRPLALSGREASCDVCLPRGINGPLPAVIWIQPGLHAMSPRVLAANRCLDPREPSVLFLVERGFALVQCPQLHLEPFAAGDPLEMVERLLGQVRMIADTLVASGIADRDRLGIGGHCLGAYATALLLARTKMFRAAVGSAGIYNLASQPFGGALTGHRSLADAHVLYLARSPV